MLKYKTEKAPPQNMNRLATFGDGTCSLIKQIQNLSD